jgi:hypothetical protein
MFIYKRLIFSEFGDKKLMEVHVKGVQKALEKNSTGDNAAV